MSYSPIALRYHWISVFLHVSAPFILYRDAWCPMQPWQQRSDVAACTSWSTFVIIHVVHHFYWKKWVKISVCKRPLVKNRISKFSTFLILLGFATDFHNAVHIFSDFLFDNSATALVTVGFAWPGRGEPNYGRWLMHSVGQGLAGWLPDLCSVPARAWPVGPQICVQYGFPFAVCLRRGSPRKRKKRLVSLPVS